MSFVAKRSRHTCRIIGGVAACCLLLSSGAVAQVQKSKTAPPTAAGKPVAKQQEQPAPQRPAWVLNCTNQDAGLVCTAGQLVVFRQGQQTIRVNAAVRVDPKSKKPTLLLQLPLGVYLPSGVTLKFGGGKAKAIAFQSCNPNGCVAENEITAAEINTLVQGADLKLSVRTSDKKPIEFVVPAKGFAAAYAKMTGK
jgi:invasion protein IalB